MEIVSLAKEIIEVGFAASAAIVVLGLVVWHQWKIVPMMGALLYSSQRLIESADELAADLSVHHTTATALAQRAADMHSECKEHGGQLDEMISGMSEFRVKLLDRLARVEQEMALLKAKIE